MANIFMVKMTYATPDELFIAMMKEIEYEIELLDGRVDTIPISKVLDRMGFPENYIEIIDK